MIRKFNKHGPDPDAVCGAPMPARKGNCFVIRNRSGGRSRDGTSDRSRDGTERMPHDITILRFERAVIRYLHLQVQPFRLTLIRGKTRFRKRKNEYINRPVGPVMGELCPVESKSAALISCKLEMPLSLLKYRVIIHPVNQGNTSNMIRIMNTEELSQILVSGGNIRTEFKEAIDEEAFWASV